MNLIMLLNKIAIGAQELKPVVEEAVIEWVLNSEDRCLSKTIAILPHVGVSEQSFWRDLLYSHDLSSCNIEVLLEVDQNRGIGYFDTRIDPHKSFDEEYALLPIKSVHNTSKYIHVSEVLSFTKDSIIRSGSQSRIPKLKSIRNESCIDMLSISSRIDRSDFDWQLFEQVLVQHVLVNYLGKLSTINEMINLLRQLGLSDIDIFRKARIYEIEVGDYVNFILQSDDFCSSWRESGTVVFIEEYSDSYEYIISIEGEDDCVEVRSSQIVSRDRNPRLRPLSNKNSKYS